MNGIKKSMRKNGALGQLLIPLIALGILILFNVIYGLLGPKHDLSFFNIELATNSSGGKVLSGNLITIIDNASILAIIAMGMTLVTAACGGQDISVGAVGAIAGAFFVKVANAGDSITTGSFILGVLVCILGTIAFMMFNGTLVSVFKIQPMIATLILFSCGRSIAYWINGSAAPQLKSPIIDAIGTTIPGVPIPTSIFIVILMVVVLLLIFRFTNLRLFVLLGVCVAVAAVIGVSRMHQLNHKTLLNEIEMDAILAVAIGGNNLGGGKFRLAGSILGAYIIQMLSTTLYSMGVQPDGVKFYKAIVIIILVVVGSPVIKSRITTLVNRIRSGKAMAAAGRGVE